jgi:ankyrin repeat protein
MAPLSVSVLHQHRDVVELLIAVKGVDVNRTDKYGWTALSWAAKNKDEAMMKLLLGNGAEQFPYQEPMVEGGPSPQESLTGSTSCCFPSDYRPKLSHA